MGEHKTEIAQTVHIPACHHVNPAKSLNTCTSCGGSTLLDPPCQPARDVPLLVDEKDDLVARILALLTEHEYRWTTHGNDRPYDVIHCVGDCDWRLRQKALMSDDYVIEQHRQHVTEQIVALVSPPEQTATEDQP